MQIFLDCLIIPKQINVWGEGSYWPQTNTITKVMVFVILLHGTQIHHERIKVIGWKD